MPIPRPDSKMLDDLARVAGGAVNILSGMQDQLRNDMRGRMEEMATRLDLVPRDELDMAKGMIEKLRREVQTLEARIDALEGRKGTKKTTKKEAASPKTKTSKSPAKKTTKAKKKKAAK